MKLIWSEAAWEDYQWWIEQDRKTLERINALIRQSSRTPYDGLGKPEPLKRQLQGWWSRRITQEHRFVYKVATIDGEACLLIAQCRYHYGRS